MPTIRPARDDDYEAFTQLFPELRVPDQTPPRETWCTEFVPRTLVAEEGGAVVGYLHFLVYAQEGLTRHLVVAPSHHGRRIGQRLMEAFARRLRAEGRARWSLNVKPDNASALRLYARLGLAEAYRLATLRFDWALVERLPAPPASLRASEVPPALDAEAELAFGLASGALAQARALPGRVLRVVREDATGQLAAAGVFVPAFPGSFPFRAASPAAARVLLEALRPHALPEKGHMQVVTEGQPALAAALQAAGAALVLEALHLEGPLPPEA